MSEFEKFVPENLVEFETLGTISVVRKIVLGYEKNLNPVTENGGFCTPDTIKGALEWISETSDDNSMYQVRIPLSGVGLAGSITKNEKVGSPRLNLSTPLGRSASSPVAMEDFYNAVTDGIFLLDVYISLERDQMVLFDRGYSIFELTKDGQKNMLFVINPGKHSMEELAYGLSKMFKRVNTVLNAILDGVDTDYK